MSPVQLAHLRPRLLRLLIALACTSWLLGCGMAMTTTPRPQDSVFYAFDVNPQAAVRAAASGQDWNLATASNLRINGISQCPGLQVALESEAKRLVDEVLGQDMCLAIDNRDRDFMALDFELHRTATIRSIKIYVSAGTSGGFDDRIVSAWILGGEQVRLKPAVTSITPDHQVWQYDLETPLRWDSLKLHLSPGASARTITISELQIIGSYQ